MQLHMVCITFLFVHPRPRLFKAHSTWEVEEWWIFKSNTVGKLWCHWRVHTTTYPKCISQVKFCPLPLCGVHFYIVLKKNEGRLVTNMKLHLKAVRKPDLALCTGIGIRKDLNPSLHWIRIIPTYNHSELIYNLLNICYGHYVMSVTKRGIFIYCMQNWNQLPIIFVLLF